MQSLTQICKETGLTLEDAQLMLINVREDWATTETVTDGEANLIKQSARAALPGSDNQVTPVAGLTVKQQEQLINNASQVFDIPLVLTAIEEIKSFAVFEDIKNAAILETIAYKEAELDAAIKGRRQLRQDALKTSAQGIVNDLQAPIDTAKQMVEEMKQGNAQLEALLAQIKAGK